MLRPSPDAAAPAADIGAHQLVRAVVDTGAAQVMVLPNGYVAAEELVAGCTAAIGWGVEVVPVPTGSMVQGWPRWRCTIPTGRPSTTATPWPSRRRHPARIGAHRHRKGIDLGRRL